MRKAYRGVDITADLTRSCPALSLPQVCERIAESLSLDACWRSHGVVGMQYCCLLSMLSNSYLEFESARKQGPPT